VIIIIIIKIFQLANITGIKNIITNVLISVSLLPNLTKVAARALYTATIEKFGLRNVFSSRLEVVTDDVAGTADGRLLHARAVTTGKALSPNVHRRIGADTQRAMVATAPGEKLLIGRCPTRNWTQLQLHFFICLTVSVQKITFVLREINKNCCHQSCTFLLQYAPNRLSAGASSQTPLRELTVLPQTPTAFRGPSSKGREKEGRGEEGERRCVRGRGGEGSTSCALGRKRKVGAYASTNGRDNENRRGSDIISI